MGELVKVVLVALEPLRQGLVEFVVSRQPLEKLGEHSLGLIFKCFPSSLIWGAIACLKNNLL